MFRLFDYFCPSLNALQVFHPFLRAVEACIRHQLAIAFWFVMSSVLFAGSSGLPILSSRLFRKIEPFHVDSGKFDIHIFTVNFQFHFLRSNFRFTPPAICLLLYLLTFSYACVFVCRASRRRRNCLPVTFVYLHHTIYLSREFGAYRGGNVGICNKILSKVADGCWEKGRCTAQKACALSPAQCL